MFINVMHIDMRSECIYTYSLYNMCLNLHVVPTFCYESALRNPNLQISGFDHKKGISVAPESTMRFAKVTYHGSREGALHGNFDELWQHMPSVHQSWRMSLFQAAEPRQIAVDR